MKISIYPPLNKIGEGFLKPHLTLPKLLSFKKSKLRQPLVALNPGKKDPIEVIFLPNPTGAKKKPTGAKKTQPIEWIFTPYK
jgi:hypothetical protein